MERGTETQSKKEEHIKWAETSHAGSIIKKKKGKRKAGTLDDKNGRQGKQSVIKKAHTENRK